jgi:glycosyltransferase involved in cell wall biosynthesis
VPKSKVVDFELPEEHPVIKGYKSKGPTHRPVPQRRELPPLPEKEPEVLIERASEIIPVIPAGFSYRNYPSPPQTGNEKVTVVIGHRGEFRLPGLLRTIESFYRQNVKPLVCVVEQDSKPLCQSVLEPLVDKYIYTYSEDPYNRSWAFNVGVNQCESDILILHDGDLVVPIDYVDRSIRGLRDIHALQPWSRIVYLTEESSRNWPQAEKVPIRVISNTGIHGGSMAVRRDWYLHIGGMDERCEGWGAEDDAFYEKARKVGKLRKVGPNGSLLYHLYHPVPTNKHQHWEKNKKIWAEYAVSSPVQIHRRKQTIGPIGDPLRGERIARERKLLENRDSGKIKHLHVIYDVEGWAYYKRAEALLRYCPEDFIVTIGKSLPQNFKRNPPDALFILPYGAVDSITQQVRNHTASTILIGSINVGWPRRVEFVSKLLKRCNYVIINNEDMWSKCGKLPRTIHFSNGVDHRIFKPTGIPVNQRKPKVLWTGSTYHAKLKGYDILKGLDQSLASKGIGLDLRLVDSHGEKYTAEEMAHWYNTGTIYVVASESEGTPNPALEAASCGLGIVTTKVGNMLELIQDKVNGVFVERHKNSILSGIFHAHENITSLSQQILEDIKPWDWRIKSEQFFSLVRDLWNKHSVSQ